MSQDSFVKQNRKLHKNKKITNRIKPKFDTIKEDSMQPLTEDVEMEEIADRITSGPMNAVKTKLISDNAETIEETVKKVESSSTKDATKLQLEKVEEMLKNIQKSLEN